MGKTLLLFNNYLAHDELYRHMLSVYAKKHRFKFEYLLNEVAD